MYLAFGILRGNNEFKSSPMLVVVVQIAMDGVNPERATVTEDPGKERQDETQQEEELLASELESWLLA